MAIYLDYNATCPIKPQVISKMVDVMEQVGNPSSQHSFGRDARTFVEVGREAIAERLGVAPSSVVFTGCGTEADNLALNQTPIDTAYVSAVEHPALLGLVPASQTLKIHPNGLVDFDALTTMLNAKPPGLLSVQMVNSETGVIQPIAEISTLAKKYGWLVHTDAVQALGKQDFSFAHTGVDLMTISAHKIGGPQGVAALITRSGFDTKPMLQGGGQERNRRSGTENVAGIAGFGEAVKLLDEDLNRQQRLEHLRDAFESEIVNSGIDVKIVGRGSTRVANTSCILMPQVKAATQLMNFDLQGFAVSAGSACSSGKSKASGVLTAMGISEDAAGTALRASIGWDTKTDDLSKFAEAWIKLASKKASPSV